MSFGFFNIFANCAIVRPSTDLISDRHTLAKNLTGKELLFNRDFEKVTYLDNSCTKDEDTQSSFPTDIYELFGEDH